jgi:hypothetical protein
MSYVFVGPRRDKSPRDMPMDHFYPMVRLSPLGGRALSIPVWVAWDNRMSWQSISGTWPDCRTLGGAA